ncbi:MAG: hypothetical protein M1834_008424 [Cirrosporium novae-zelandiae]|nr:MAG: hypothetical protein M1834_008424 [Cirrosporium novae-zelandiae]
MKLFSVSFLLFLFAGEQISQVHCMPTLGHIGKYLHGHGAGTTKRLGKRSLFSSLESAIELELAGLTFNPLTEPVDITGDHAFKAPNFTAGDIRGPCPGLNALANHGYLPRDGVTSMLDAILAIHNVLGMGIDLGTVLGVYATVELGNPLSLDPGFSIGGESDEAQNILDNALGLLGEPQGLDGGHNIIESDASPTRGDLYVTGENYKLQMDNFMEWYNLADDNGTFSMDAMLELGVKRYEQSVATNPYFYYGPVAGLFFRNAGFAFIGRIMRNHSTEHPEGVLTKDCVKSFFAIYGEEGNFEYREGWEKIPDNWYRAPKGSEYGLLNFNLDIIDWVAKEPILANIGGNVGSVDSFMGVNIANLTGGVYDATMLLEGNNLLCFVLEVMKFASPNSLSSIYSTIGVPYKLLTDALDVALLKLNNCPVVADLTAGGKPAWEGLQDLFPGANKSGSAF